MEPDRYGSHKAAAYVGEKPATWRAYVARGQAPQPDGFDQTFGRNFWLKTTLDEWLATPKRTTRVVGYPEASGTQ